MTPLSTPSPFSGALMEGSPFVFRPQVRREGDPEEGALPRLLLDFSYDVQPGLDGFYASK